MVTEQQRAVVLNAVEKRRLDPRYEFSADEIDVIRMVFDHHFEAEDGMFKPTSIH